MSHHITVIEIDRRVAGFVEFMRGQNAEVEAKGAPHITEADYETLRGRLTRSLMRIANLRRRVR